MGSLWEGEHCAGFSSLLCWGEAPGAPVPCSDAVPFADDIGELGTEVDPERALGEPLVKRERSEPGHSLQEI